MFSKLRSLNRSLAITLVIVLTVIIYLIVFITKRCSLPINMDPYLFADSCAVLNGATAVCLVLGVYYAKAQKNSKHQITMLIALVNSCLFIVSYFLQHLFVVETHFPSTGSIRIIYFFVLISHILLSAISAPLILWMFMLGARQEKDAHRKLSRIVFPLWLYVSITGVIVYLMISPHYPRP